MPKPCSVQGCSRPRDSKGYCGKHYMRFKRHGDPLAGGTESGAPQRFIDETCSSQKDECIVWPYARTKRGYAQLGDRRMVSRIVCEAVHGAPPNPRMEAAHICGKGHEGCINPRHLRWATHRQNCGDRAGHGTNTVGSKNAHAKLSEADVLAIRALDGVVHREEIAERFGVKPATIYTVVARKRWHHL